MPFSSLKKMIGGSMKNRREIWLEEATPESTLVDLTRLIVDGEKYILPYLAAQDLESFNTTFGSISESTEIPTGKIIEVIKKHASPDAQTAVDAVSQELVTLLKTHAQFPFVSRKQTLDAASLLRVGFLLTGKSSKLFGWSSTLSNGTTDRVIRRVRTTEDSLRLVFWSLTSGSSDIIDVPLDTQESDVIDVLGVVQARHALHERFAPLSRDQLQPLCNRLLANLPTLRVGRQIDKVVLDRWTRFIMALSGDKSTKVEVPEFVDFEEFVEYAGKIRMLETLDDLFRKAFFNC